MSSPVVTITPDKTILEAAKLMKKKGIGALVVVEESMKLAGIITERDFVNKIVAESLNVEATQVEDVMSSDVYTVSTDATLLDISKIMNKHRIRHAIVMDAGKVVGVVTARDLIELVSS